MARECLLRIGGKILHPLPQHVLMNGQIARGLLDRNAALPHQLDCLNLELSREPSSLHDLSPAPLNTLTWCLQNRVQASRVWLTPRSLSHNLHAAAACA